MEDGQTGGLIVAVAVPVGVVPKPGQEFATTRGPKTEVHNAAVLLAKMQSVTLKLAVSFRFDNYYLLDIKTIKDQENIQDSKRIFILQKVTS